MTEYRLTPIHYNGKEVWYAVLQDHDRQWGHVVETFFTGTGNTPLEAMQHANALKHTHMSNLYQVTGERT